MIAGLKIFGGNLVRVNGSNRLSLC